MNYKESTIKHKELLRERLMELFDRDISEANCHFSSRNYAFVFSAGSFPVALRVSVNGANSRKDVISELMWVDDLREAIPTISQAVPSKLDRIAEEFTIEGTRFCATMFRKANGDVLPVKYWTPGYFEETGRMLGQIHKVSREGCELGFRYKRKGWYEKASMEFDCYDGITDPRTKEAAVSLVRRLRALPESPEWFGMIHGDYQRGNFFVDWGTVWVFDFDDCCYGHFMYDVACAVFTFAAAVSHEHGCSMARRFYGPEGIYTCFKKGYNQFYHLPEEQWARLEDFMKLRCCESLSIMIQSKALPEEAMGHYIKLLSRCLLAEGGVLEALERS